MNRRYLLISPGRNEARYMRHTLDSVIAQSVQPARWAIVDNGGPPPRAVLRHLCGTSWRIVRSVEIKFLTESAL